jgi:hypothetical protein
MALIAWLSTNQNGADWELGWCKFKRTANEKKKTAWLLICVNLLKVY